jgi:hypothetical protein
MIHASMIHAGKTGTVSICPLWTMCPILGVAVTSKRPRGRGWEAVPPDSGIIARRVIAGVGQW